MLIKQQNTTKIISRLHTLGFVVMRFYPEQEAFDVDCSGKGGQIFGISCCNFPPLFEMGKGIFHQMAHAVEIFIIFASIFPVFAWGYVYLHTLVLCSLNNHVTVIALIGNQMFCFKSLYEFVCTCAIRCGSCCNNSSDRQTMRIHGQMYLGVGPPFVRPIP